MLNSYWNVSFFKQSVKHFWDLSWIFSKNVCEITQIRKYSQISNFPKSLQKEKSYFCLCNTTEIVEISFVIIWLIVLNIHYMSYLARHLVSPRVSGLPATSLVGQRKPSGFHWWLGRSWDRLKVVRVYEQENTSSLSTEIKMQTWQCTVWDYSGMTHMELSKLLTRPGVSPGVGWWKQGLLILQTMPWSHASVPADGSALFGKWPEALKTRKQFQSNNNSYLWFWSKLAFRKVTI